MTQSKKEKFHHWLDKLIPTYARLPLFIVVVFNFSVYFLSRLFAADRKHYILSSALDSQIPLIPWTILIYVGCYLYWIAYYLYCSGLDKERGLQFLLADILGKVVCAFCYTLFPTTMIRPEVTEPGIWNDWIRILYQLDPADNLFPSLHCFISWLCYIGVRGNKTVPRWVRSFALVFSILVFLSTLTTRQHVIIDIFAGVLLAELCYFLATRVPVLSLLEKFRKKQTDKSNRQYPHKNN